MTPVAVRRFATEVEASSAVSIEIMMFAAAVVSITFAAVSVSVLRLFFQNTFSTRVLVVWGPLEAFWNEMCRVAQLGVIVAPTAAPAASSVSHSRRDGPP